jgi:outer membrane immunogenic protein
MKYVALVAAAAMGVGLAHNAMAADFGFRGPVYQTPAFVAPTWTGVYIGVNGGWGWTTSNSSNISIVSPAGAFAFTVPGTSNNANSAVFGGQLGYLHQTGNWVWGIEGDVDGAQIRATQSGSLAPGGTFVGGSAFLNEKQNWLASIRGRIGYTWGPGLIYVTGGAAWTGIEANGGATLVSGETNTFTLSTTRGGYVLGGGYEWMFAPNWSVRGEYLYYGFQGNLIGPSIVFPGAAGAGGAGATLNGSVNKFNTSVFRIGLDYKLDWWR